MERAKQIWENLLEGNERFWRGSGDTKRYEGETLRRLATESQEPKAVVLACCDSRVCPEILFDQPLGSLFVSRAPGNCATDGARWAVEMAVAELKVPLVVVLGHTGCLAVTQIIDGKIGGAGRPLRLTISHAVHRARVKGVQDLLREAVNENARMAAQELSESLSPVRKAFEAGNLGVVTALYDMPVGRVETVHWMERPGNG